MKLPHFLLPLLVVLAAPVGAWADDGAQAQSEASAAPETRPDPELDWAMTFALGAPQPLSIGAEVRCVEEREEGRCSHGLKAYSEGGWISLPISKRKLTIWSVQVGVRSDRPKGLVLGLGFGFRRVSLGADLTEFKLDGVSLASQATFAAYSLFLQPNIGWRWKLSDSLALQFDLGAQVPLPVFRGGSLSFEPAAGTGPIDLSAEQQGVQRVGKLLVPMASLLRFIWDI